MNQKELIEILRSENFTLAYHDNGDCYLYVGKFKYEDLPELEDYRFDNNYDGYAPEVVVMMAKALSGRVVSI